jgi:hypothetical protein
LLDAIQVSAHKIKVLFNGKAIMSNEVELLEQWRELTPEKQQQVLEFVELLRSESEMTPAKSDFVPKTPLAKKLWKIRQRLWFTTAQRRGNRTGTCCTSGWIP